MPKQRLILIIGIALALITVFMLNVYLNQQRQIAFEEASRQIAKKQESQIAVLVAKEDISKGTTIDPQILETKIFPREYVVPQAVISFERIAGMITVAPISKGEQITLTKLSQLRQAGAGGLAEATPVGKRAITISVDNIAALAGMVKPGDYVDVIAMVAIPVMTPDNKQVTQTSVIPLFQNVEVLAVGSSTSAYESDRRYSKGEQVSSGLITLALTLQEANILAFVQEQSKIRLVLRSPADSKTQPFQFTTWDTLIQYIMPPELLKKSQGEEGAKEGSYIEIYRGLQKEKIPLTK